MNEKIFGRNNNLKHTVHLPEYVGALRGYVRLGELALHGESALLTSKF